MKEKFPFAFARCEQPLSRSNSKINMFIVLPQGNFIPFFGSFALQIRNIFWVKSYNILQDLRDLREWIILIG